MRQCIAVCVCLAAGAALGADAEDAGRRALAARGQFKIARHHGALVVDIALKGDASVGELFDVRRGEALIGYAAVSEMVSYWPKLEFVLGGGAEGDLLTRLSRPMPKVQLLTDSPDCREAKELKALVGDRLHVEKIADRMRAPAQDEALVILYHTGAPFMMGDPIVEPHAARGGKVVADMLAYCHLRGIPADESFFDQPPSLRIIDVGPLTAGLSEEARIPWYGTRERVVTVELKSRTKSRSKRPRKPVTRKVKKRQFVARIAPGTPSKESQKRIATDESTDNTTLIYEQLGGGILACDLISLNGRGGIDPGCKNKWVFVARALGSGPQYAVFRPAKPAFEDLLGEIEALIDSKADRVKTTMEGGASGSDNLVKSIAFGPADKPLVLIVGCLDGADWLSSCAILRLMELLLDPDDDVMEWAAERLRIKCIPCLNMAGYPRDAAPNANGVLIDRNFAYHWDAFADKKTKGSEPFSEPESAILQRIVEKEKPALVLDIGVGSYDDGYFMVYGRDATRAQRDLCRVARDVLDARLRRRFVLGEQPLRVKLFKSSERPSLANWASSKGAQAVSLSICGDAEDSLINTDVAVEAALALLYTTALAQR